MDIKIILAKRIEDRRINQREIQDRINLGLRLDGAITQLEEILTLEEPLLEDKPTEEDA